MSKPAGKVTPTATEAEAETYRLRLFVAGDEPNSKTARENLTRICETALDGRYELEVVDVLEDFEAALDCGLVVTPALMLVSPLPSATVFGDLSDTRKVLSALRLREDE
jgi:circadian clock protein KaiB